MILEGASYVEARDAAAQVHINMREDCIHEFGGTPHRCGEDSLKSEDSEGLEDGCDDFRGERIARSEVVEGGADMVLGAIECYGMGFASGGVATDCFGFCGEVASNDAAGRGLSETVYHGHFFRRRQWRTQGF